MKKLIAILLALVCAASVWAAPMASADTYYNSSNAIAYNQYVSPWAGLYYGGGSIGATGCGILSTTNAINYLNGFFTTSDKANAFIQDWASYAHSIGGYNPGSSSSGGYRYILFGTDISTTPPLQSRYGSTYNFNMPIKWTENWNSANYYNGGYYNNIYVNSQTSLKNYLAGDAVAIAHVPGHFICLADYNASTDSFLVLDSAPTTARGTGNGVAWISAYNLSGGLPALTVGGYCVLQSTAPTVNNPYPYTVDSNTLMLHDGDSTTGITSAYNTTIAVEEGNKRQGSGSLLLNCTAPAAQASGNKIGGMAIQSLKSSTNLSSYNYVVMDVYVTRAMTGSNGLQVNFATNGQDGFNKMIAINEWAAGWHTVVIDLSTLSATNSAVWSSINTIRYTWFNYAGSSDATRILLDQVRATKTRPGVYPYAEDSNTMMLYDGDSLSTLTSAYNTNISMNATKTQGTYSLKMEYAAPAAQVSGNQIGGMVHHTLNSKANISSYEYVAFDLYFSRAMTGSNGFQVNFATGAQDGYNYLAKINDYCAGWHSFVVKKSDISKVVDTADWAAINQMRFTWFNYMGATDGTYILIDNVRALKEAPTLTTEYPYSFTDGLMLYDGDENVRLTGAYSTTLAIERTNYKQGTGSLHMSCTAPAAQASGNQIGGMVLQTLKSATNMSGYNYVVLDVYVTRKLTGSNGLQVNFATKGQDGFNKMIAINDWSAGWHRVVIDLSTLTATNSADWTKINTIRYTWFNYVGATDATSFLIDNVRAVKTVYSYTIDDNSMMLYDGEYVEPVTSSYETSVSVDTSVKSQGSGGLNMTYHAPTAQADSTKIGGMAYVNLYSDANLTNYKTLQYDIYVPQDISGSCGFQLNLGTSKGDGYNFMKPMKGLTAGWHTIQYDIENVTAVSGVTVDKSNINTIRLTWFNYDGLTLPYIVVDNIQVTKTALIDSATQQVIDAIAALPVTVTLEQKSAVASARTAYDALSDAQKAKVSNYSLLTAAEATIAVLEQQAADQAAALAVDNQIAALPAVITTTDKAAVESARAAYDALTDDQKALVTKLADLQDDEVALAAALAKEEADKAAALAVDTQIAALPSPITVNDLEAVQEARLAYNTLTDDQKRYVTKEAALTAMEQELELLVGKEAMDKAAAQKVDEMISALPAVITTADKSAVESARAAYDALTDEQKALVTKLADLQDDEVALATALAKEEADKAAAQAVMDQIDALDGTDADAVADARTDYTALTAEQKALVTNLSKLETLEAAMADQTAANAVIEAIAGLPAEITVDDQNAVETVRGLYNSLTETQKAKVTNLGVLVTAEQALAEALVEEDKATAKMVEDMIAALPHPDDVVYADENDVNAARQAYENLTEAQKQYVTNLEKLMEIEDNLSQLPWVPVKAQIVIDQIVGLPADVTVADKVAIETVRTAYDGLAVDHKPYVSNLAVLEAAEHALADAIAKDEADKAAALAVDNQIAALPATVTTADKVAVEAARSAYNALTDDQKALVTKLADLVTAEQALADLDNTVVLYGDVTGDGKVDAADALAVLKKAVGKEAFTEEQIKVGDVDENGKIDAADALLILKKAVGKQEIFPVEE